MPLHLALTPTGKKGFKIVAELFENFGEAIQCSKEEAHSYLSQKREEMMQLTHELAIKMLITSSKIDNKLKVIEAISDNNLFRADDSY